MTNEMPERDIVIEPFAGTHTEFTQLWRNPYVQAGWRVASIRLNTMGFGAAMLSVRTYAVAYYGGNFNITPPPMAECLTSVYDAIGPLLDEQVVASPDPKELNEYFQLDPHNQAILNEMPSGWETAKLREYSVEEIPPHSLNMLRLTWAVGVAEPDDGCSLIHPSYDRLLTIGEYAALENLDFNTWTNPNIDEWLQQLRDLFISNHWKEEDWESSYNNPRGSVPPSWVGKNTPGVDCKHFNLTQYHPNHYQQYDVELPFKRFNVRDDGSVIVPWDQISQQHFKNKYGCKPIDYPVNYSDIDPNYPLSHETNVSPQYLHHRDANAAKYRCERCHATFNCLPRHCPGEPLTAEQRKAIEAKQLNFIDGQWLTHG